MEAPGRKYRVAVCGCGIAGATAAFLLAENGHNVTLFEQALKCGPVGAGILLQPSGQVVLAQLGMLDHIEGQSSRIRELHAVRENGKLLIRLPYSEIREDSYALGIQRGVLFESLFRRCQEAGVAIREGHRVTRRSIEDNVVFVEQSSGNRDGPFDFVLAADGSRSALRESIESSNRSHTYRHAALWYVGLNQQITDKLFQIVHGTKVLIGLLPTGEGRCSLFWGEPEDQWPRLRDRGIEAWKSRLLAYCPQAEETVADIRSFDELTFTNYRHVRMSQWFDSHTLFLGDAAHAMSPHLGQGVNLALIDARTFVTALQSSTSFAEACQKYIEQRRHVVQYYWHLTRFLTPFFQSDSRVLGWGRDTFLPWMPRIPWVRRQMVLTMAGLKETWL